MVPFELTAIVPLIAVVADASDTVSVPFSKSLSLPNTLITFAAQDVVESVSFTATGAWLVGAELQAGVAGG